MHTHIFNELTVFVKYSCRLVISKPFSLKFPLGSPSVDEEKEKSGKAAVLEGKETRRKNHRKQEEKSAKV